MARANTLLELLQHPDPASRRQGHELVAALPELVDELVGPEGVLWDGTDAGVLTGLELLLRLAPIDEARLWVWGRDSMANAGPLPWQQPDQHRRDLQELTCWEAGALPPSTLRDICRRGLWMLQRWCQDIEAADLDDSLWLRARARFSDLPSLLSALEFYTDTLDDEPDPDEIAPLEDELCAVGNRVRAPLAELLVLVHLLRAASRSPRALARAARWHQRHLAPMLTERLTPPLG